MSILAIILITFVTLLFIFFQHAYSKPQNFLRRPNPKKENIEPNLREHPQKTIFRRKKPSWVRKEVIRLKALMPNNGCRKIADVFNRLHADKHCESVSKSYVYNVIIAHRYEIHVLRQNNKHKRPKPLARNIIWSLDLTTVSDEYKQNTVLGIIDNGTRACLLLKQLQDKSSITLLRQLLNIIDHYGKPSQIWTDNESVFTSSIFKGALLLLSIRHRRSEIACPWQNGRIERFFGTFKEAIRKIEINEGALQLRLKQFRSYYNHVRTHEYLDGRTPAELWNKKRHNRKGKFFYFNAWQGVLTGFYLPPD